MRGEGCNWVLRLTRNTLLDIYHIKIICEYLWKDTTQQLLGLHDAKITNTYEIMCMRGEGCNWVLRLTPN